MEGNHAVEEQEVLALGNDFSLTIFGNENRELLQVCPNKVPNALLQCLTLGGSVPQGHHLAYMQK